ncbi:MAG: IMP dehydrogenase [Bacteriovorax sp.]|nr:IMP dehydrogenase [Bacteriovorax sp.]
MVVLPIMNDFLLSYDTVTLSPRHSLLSSRSKADTTVNLCGWKFKLPVVPANMKDVINPSIAKFFSENDYFYIYHRFGQMSDDIIGSDLNTVYFVKLANKENWKLISISTGVSKESITELMTIQALRLRVDFITVDVAHADHDNVKPTIEFVRKHFPNTKLIVGNVATYGGVTYLTKLGVDVIKVGIGGGSICTTRYMTGFHVPTLQSLHDIEEGKEYSRGILGHLPTIPPIIADGGAKHYGDVAKALTFGATMVMAGGWFASCIDSPAKIVDGKKVYRGSTSYELKGHKKNVEGRVIELVEGTTYEQRLVEIKDSLQSSISYAGGSDLTSFKSVDWARILPFH